MVWIVEQVGWKRWALPLVVAGLNPITLYCLWQLCVGFVRDTLKTHLGQGVFAACGTLYAPTVESLSILAAFWVILYWMYRRRIFLRL